MTTEKGRRKERSTRRDKSPSTKANKARINSSLIDGFQYVSFTSCSSLLLAARTLTNAALFTPQSVICARVWVGKV